jgi:hypothetical protein
MFGADGSQAPYAIKNPFHGTQILAVLVAPSRTFFGFETNLHKKPAPALGSPFRPIADIGARVSMSGFGAFAEVRKLPPMGPERDYQHHRGLFSSTVYAHGRFTLLADTGKEIQPRGWRGLLVYGHSPPCPARPEHPA